MTRTSNTKRDRIRQLGLEPHPEGGYYAETFRSSMLVPTLRGDRAASTAIWFLLGVNDVSTFHRLAHEEHWCWHEGLPVTLHVIDELGNYSTATIGAIDDGYIPALVIPANVWFGASVEREEYTGKAFSGRILPENAGGLNESIPPSPKEFSGRILPENARGLNESIPPSQKEFSGRILPENRKLPQTKVDRPTQLSAQAAFDASILVRDYTLITAIVAPGFDFQDFELASRQSLTQMYPALSDVIRRFTRQ